MLINILGVFCNAVHPGKHDEYQSNTQLVAVESDIHSSQAVYQIKGKYFL